MAAERSAARRPGTESGLQASSSAFELLTCRMISQHPPRSIQGAHHATRNGSLARALIGVRPQVVVRIESLDDRCVTQPALNCPHRLAMPDQQSGVESGANGHGRACRDRPGAGSHERLGARQYSRSRVPRRLAIPIPLDVRRPWLTPHGRQVAEGPLSTSHPTAQTRVVYWVRAHQRIRRSARNNEGNPRGLSRFPAYISRQSSGCPMTTLVTGSTNDLSREQLTAMLTEARHRLINIEAYTP
jgi:hypothetical protein